MRHNESVIAIFDTHLGAEEGIKRLATSGFDMRNLTIVGKGYHTEEQVVGFYNSGDRVKFWGKLGAYWGGLWGLFFGGVFLTVPVVGSVVVLGFLATALVSAVEGAIVVGGLSALGAALYSIGMPEDTVLKYEAAVKADKFLVMAHGLSDEVGRAKTILATAAPSLLAIHPVTALAPPSPPFVSVSA